MLPLHFESVHANGVNLYHYLPGEQPALTRHWPGLFQDWPEGPTPFTEYAVNNNNMEEVAIYVGLTWRLTEGLARYAIPTYYRDDAERHLEQEPVLVDWEYEVDAEELKVASRNKGFVPGRSTHGFRPGLASWCPGNAERAGLFHLATPRDLVRMLHAVLLDASSEITVFAVEPGPDRHAALVSALRGPNRPSLSDVITRTDVFVDLTIGSDIDCFDSIMVASHADLRSRIDTLAADYGHRITAYENRAAGLPNTGAFLHAMPALSGITLDGS
ncbi:hypothetical protein OG735_11985 [Streptomyces sp. NBC_01210]|uniref:hypothetical protein n=1 Tax=Streptomyces sp. NBC_01210 TaxID=2903774 RepID=UPI002E129642|nr:hypothetical protein OG735_11985 [Streptomyces sp. NBC_01210]